MTLTRRNVGGGDSKPRSNSMWEQEANEYWNKMEPSKRYKNAVRGFGVVILGVAILSGAMWTAQRAYTSISLAELASVKERYFSIKIANVTVDPALAIPASSVAPQVEKSAPATTLADPSSVSAPSAGKVITDPATVDLLRARCRVRGVQTRWHEETCRKLCVRDPQNNACMNGCSYGSITVTKATCDQLPITAIPTATECPDGVNCVMACRAYETEAPVPMTKHSCERACTNVVQSSCSRILQIYRDLYKGTLQ